MATKTYAPVGECIYCGTKEGKLGKEHIVPLALNGNLILPFASCDNCAQHTKKVEQAITRSMYGGLRIREGFATRRPADRPKSLTLCIINEHGVREEVEVAAANLPRIYPSLDMPPAGILVGDTPTDKMRAAVVVAYDGEDLHRFFGTPSSGYKDVAIRAPVIPMGEFYLMLAKIAHSYAVAELGLSRFQPFLTDLIRFKSNTPAYWVGGALHPIGPGDATYWHRLSIVKVNGTDLLTVVIRLMSFLNVPEFQVVVGSDNLGP